jgi:hypothetical protein
MPRLKFPRAQSTVLSITSQVNDIDVASPVRFLRASKHLFKRWEIIVAVGAVVGTVVAVDNWRHRGFGLEPKASPHITNIDEVGKRKRGSSEGDRSWRGNGFK